MFQQRVRESQHSLMYEPKHGNVAAKAERAEVEVEERVLARQADLSKKPRLHAIERGQHRVRGMVNRSAAPLQ